MATVVLLLNRCLLAVILAQLLVGCGRIVPADIAGTYVRTFRGLSETVVVKPDGMFKQTVNYGDGETFTITDSWTNDYKQVCFKRLYFTFSVETGNTIKPPELRHMAYLRWEQDVLVVNADIANRAYLFRKQSQAKGQ